LPELKRKDVDSPTTALPERVTTGWVRPMAFAAAILFLVSSLFPLAAGLSRNAASFPRWWGAVDVGLAFLLAIPAFAIITLTRGKISKEAVDASYRSYRFLTHGIWVMILLFFFWGDRISWIHCATGFAWRAWLLLYCLPAWFTALKTPAIPRLR